MLRNFPMDNASHDLELSVRDVERALALGVGSLLLVDGLTRRSLVGVCLAVSAAPLLYRGVTGRWPPGFDGFDSELTTVALAGARDVHVRESVRLECAVAQVLASGDGSRSCRVSSLT